MDTPLRIPPPGVTANFDDQTFLGFPLLVTAGACLFLILLFAAVRIFVTVYVLKKWKLDDFIYYCSCVAGVAFITFEIMVIMSKSITYHAWNVYEHNMTDSSLFRLLLLSIALGPVLLLLKLSLFCFFLRHFGSIPWARNCAYIGITVLGLAFSAYTTIVATSCRPTSESNTISYLAGFNRKQCSALGGVTAVSTIIIEVVNGIGDLYLTVISMPLISILCLNSKQTHKVFLIQISGVLLCICSLVGAYFRYIYYRSTDLTGGLVPYYVVLALEIAIGLMIPSMPYFAIIWHRCTDPDINDTGMLATPNARGISNLSIPCRLVSSQPESQATWRKTHLSIEEIPYRKTSSEYYQHRVSDPHPMHAHRMKALPSTPLPIMFSH